MTIFVLVDVEACGPSPMTGTMTEFGAVALNKSMTAVQGTFHGLLVEAEPDPENPAVPLIQPGAKRYSSTEVFTNFRKWLLGLDDRVVFVSDNPTYDGMWIWCGFDAAGVENPFGHSGRRIADFAAGLERNWRQTQKWKKLRQTPHTHNPVDDSMGNAEALIALIASTKEN